MNQEKNTKKRKQIITISIFSVIIIMILIFFLFFLRKSEEPIEEQFGQEETQQPVLIETEFLSEDELSDLGVSSETRAQVISRDPLIYKVIEDDDEIVEDISSYLEPIRE